MAQQMIYKYEETIQAECMHWLKEWWCLSGTALSFWVQEIRVYTSKQGLSPDSAQQSHAHPHLRRQSAPIDIQKETRRLSCRPYMVEHSSWMQFAAQGSNKAASYQRQNCTYGC